MGRRRELALTLTLSRTRERGNKAATSPKLALVPLSRVRERAGVRASVVHRHGAAPA
jgi:hypothetical protein